ncbi:MAG: methyltransferase [Planctomycetes bacterium]|nr:methyltransferase [Planctomycetota bacterium]
MNLKQLKKDIIFSVNMRGHELTFRSTWGLFSPRRIDDGSYLLVKHADIQPDDVTLDIGCGYGAIGIAVAKLSPGGRVHMVDKDFIAVDYAARNAEINGLSNCEVYLSNAFSHVDGDVAFNNVVANLPAQVGKEMLSIILRDAKMRLRPGGRLYVVTVNGLRKFIRRNFEDTFGNYEKIKQGKHHTVAMAVKGA